MLGKTIICISCYTWGKGGRGENYISLVHVTCETVLVASSHIWNENIYRGMGGEDRFDVWMSL